MKRFCEECDHLHPATRTKAPWHWRCLKAPVPPGFGYMSRDWSPDPPYAKCVNINSDGECPDWTARRLPPEETDVQ